VKFLIEISLSCNILDITHIRCLDPDCKKFTQSQYALPSRKTQRPKLYGVKVQHVVDPQTDLPVFHFIGSEYPSDKSLYMLVACADMECTDMSNVVDYGERLDVNKLQVADIFADKQGIISACSLVNNAKTNETMNLIVRVGRTKEKSSKGLTIVQPAL
jgi:hypothetical protein